MGSKRGRRACRLWASLATALAFTGLLATVHFNYRGNWTALFCHGSRFPVPPALRAENIHVFQNSGGYDGQFYHFMAHDPLLKGDTARYIDAPRLRCRRILMSALAWLVGGGGRMVHAAYVALMLASVWLGAWWLARAAVQQEAHAAWGLAYLTIPGTLISLDRMTVDGPLAALTAGFALYALSGGLWRLYLVLVAAPLVRETGMLLTAAGVLDEFRRGPRRAVLLASSALPALAWFVFVHFRFPGKDPMLVTVPFAGLIRRLFTVAGGESRTPLWRLAAALDWVSLAGVLIACMLAVRLVRERRDAVTFAVVFQILLLSTLKAELWLDPYTYTRLCSPLLVLLMAGGRDSRWGWRWLPAGLMLPRIGLQLGRQLLGVLRGIFG